MANFNYHKLKPRQMNMGCYKHAYRNSRAGKTEAKGKGQRGLVGTLANAVEEPLSAAHTERDGSTFMAS